MKKNKELKKKMENKSLLIWKMAIASALSWEIAKLLGSDHPYLAPISVILCLQTTVNKSIRFSYHRMVGTVIGIVVVVLGSPFIKVSGWTLGLLILIGSFIAKWLKRDETAIHQVALTVLLVFVMEHRSGGDYPVDRFRDTLIGALVAVLLHMIVKPPNYTKEAERSLLKLTNQLNNTFNRVSEWIQTGFKEEEGKHIIADTKHSQQELHLSKKLISDAADSLKFNFFANKDRLGACQQKIEYLTEGYDYLLTVVETLKEWATHGIISSSQKSVWAEQIKILLTFFNKKINQGEPSTPGEILVSLPQELKDLQYQATLYHQTTSFVKKLNNL